MTMLSCRSLALALALFSMFSMQRGAIAAERLDVLWWNVEWLR
ncbi:hypothetical protein [Prosthecochloris vibrioformis]|nr:hypothetical protein [Prosthecochloris vibrioformis]